MRSFWPGRSPQITVVRASRRAASVLDLDAAGHLDLVVHRRGHHQPAAARPVHAAARRCSVVS